MDFLRCWCCQAEATEVTPEKVVMPVSKVTSLRRGCGVVLSEMEMCQPFVVKGSSRTFRRDSIM